MVNLLLPIIYLLFISLGLPDSLLGSAWPSIYLEFGVPYSYAGIISVVISLGTVISSLLSDWLTKRFKVGLVSAVSVMLTALALFGFSMAHSMTALVLLSIPYGLGAGSIDAALNNYVALHYKSRHMSWLHCMWGVGAVCGPYFMSYALEQAKGWNMGYRYISIIQLVITVIAFISIPLWSKKAALTETPSQEESTEKTRKSLSLKEVLAIPGAKAIMLAFFCYCSMEAINFVWASTYLQIYRGVTAEKAAFYAIMFYLGMTIGRFINGFLTMKLSDSQLIHLGECIMGAGLIILLIPGKSVTLGLIGLMAFGLGCAPVYPCIINSTPRLFGADKSQALIGIQMASAYLGNLIASPVFGVLSQHTSVGIFPIVLLVLFLVMAVMYQRLLKKAVEH